MPRTGPRPGLRADAQQNVEKILSAAAACLSRNAAASVSEIAQEAGVGRMTLYGHFPSREVLVEATLVRLLADGNDILEKVDLAGDPRQALATLIESSWLLLARVNAVLEAALTALPAGRVHELHAEPEQRVDNLIRRGQEEGVFRADLPSAWLASVLHHVMHGAAQDVTAGRIDEADAPRFISEAVLAAYTPRSNASA